MATDVCRRSLRRACRVRLQAGARPQHRAVRELRRRGQLHLDPHRRLPALLLRLRLRRPGVLVDLADGLRRPADGGALLRRARRQLPGRRVDLQLGQEARERDRRLAGRLDDAHRFDRHDRRGRARLPDHPAADRRTSSSSTATAPASNDFAINAVILGTRPDHLHDADQRARREADVAHQQHRRVHRADRRGAADRRARAPTSRAARTSSSRPRAPARATTGATSAPSSPPRSPRPT